MWAVSNLKKNNVPEPEASAEILLSELLGISRGELSFYRGPLTRWQGTTYRRWVARRAMREPVQRILGYAYFRNLKLYLNEHTLIPRADTESVVDLALERIDESGGACRVLDIGTGSGAIAIAIAQERPRCEVHASDINKEALEGAKKNARKNRARVEFHRADLGDSLEALKGTVDLLVSNPPYIRSADLENLAPEVRDWDPRSALDGGADGLEFFRRIFAETPFLLRAGADVVLEVGDGQADEVLELGRKAGFVPLGSHLDLTGTPRAVLLRWKPE